MRNHRQCLPFRGKSVPTGYRFLPTDEELVVCYLMKKAFSEPLPSAVVREIDAAELYSKNPKDLDASSGYEGREWFFFVYEDEDENYERIADNAEGCWRKHDERRYCIYDSNGNLLAFKVHLDYYIGKDPKAKKTHWKLEKYRLSCQQKKEGWVLIRIKRGNDGNRPTESC